MLPSCVPSKNLYPQQLYFNFHFPLASQDDDKLEARVVVPDVVLVPPITKIPEYPTAWSPQCYASTTCTRDRNIDGAPTFTARKGASTSEERTAKRKKPERRKRRFVTVAGASIRGGTRRSSDCLRTWNLETPETWRGIFPKEYFA